MGSHPPATLPFLLFLLLLPASSRTIHDCPQHCGGVDIPFPFGIGSNCSLTGFQVSCQHRSHTPLPFLSDTQLRILSIHNGELRVDSAPFVASDCAGGRRALATIALPFNGPFTISGASNRFVAIGCDTVAVVADGGTFTSGCVSLCSTRESVSSPGGACSGVGCCEAAVPGERKYLSMGAGNMFGYVNVSGFDNCSYSFVVERGGYEFREEDLRGFPGRATVAMRLEWAVGDGGGSGCGKNAYHSPAVRGSGWYLCNCSQGYAGNPYLNGSGGCQDTTHFSSRDHDRGPRRRRSWKPGHSRRPGRGERGPPGSPALQWEKSIKKKRKRGKRPVATIGTGSVAGGRTSPRRGRRRP